MSDPIKKQLPSIGAHLDASWQKYLPNENSLVMEFCPAAKPELFRFSKERGGEALPLSGQHDRLAGEPFLALQPEATELFFQSALNPQVAYLSGELKAENLSDEDLMLLSLFLLEYQEGKRCDS